MVDVQSSSELQELSSINVTVRTVTDVLHISGIVQHFIIVKEHDSDRIRCLQQSACVCLVLRRNMLRVSTHCLY